MLAPAATFDRPLPRNLQPGDEALFRAASPCACPCVTVERVADACFNANGEVFGPHGVLEASFLDARQFARRDIARYARRHAEARAAQAFLPGEYLWITDRQSHNYHHWIADCLPRLEAWVACHGGARLLLPARVLAQPFVRDSLLAWPEVQLVEPPAALARAELLAMPAKAAPAGEHHDALVRAVAKRLLARFAPGEGNEGRRLHVSRAHARFRRIANEAEALPVFAAHGYETVRLEELDLAAQVRLLARAGAVAGAHGAGLTNMMFAPTGGRVLELRQMAGPPLCFFALAAGCGHGYFYLACEPADALAHPHAGDILVNPEALDLALRGMAV